MDLKQDRGSVFEWQRQWNAWDIGYRLVGKTIEEVSLLVYDWLVPSVVKEKIYDSFNVDEERRSDINEKSFGGEILSGIAINAVGGEYSAAAFYLGLAMILDGFLRIGNETSERNGNVVLEMIVSGPVLVGKWLAREVGSTGIPKDV